MPLLADRLMPQLRRIALARDSASLADGQLLAAFIAERDPASFETLVRRHGPMVFGVCRRVVGHTQTAEDAFQAVFVVLAKRAAAVKPREQLANWLFGVAYRTALKARGGLNRRRSREKQVLAMPDVAVSPVELWADIQPILDAELAALPDRLRLPVVLCDLEGRTQRDAAKQLKLPPATLANRLTAARRKLAERLTARGITLSGGLFATVLSANVGGAAVPTGVCAAAANAGLSAIGATAGAIPESVRLLSDGVLRMMMLTKLKAVSLVAAAGLMLLGGLGVGVLPHAFAQGPPAPAAKAKPTLGPALTDAEFLKRNCETLRGTTATPTELGYFVADADANKRKKVVLWLTEAATPTALVTRIIRPQSAGAKVNLALDFGTSFTQPDRPEALQTARSVPAEGTVVFEDDVAKLTLQHFRVQAQPVLAVETIHFLGESSIDLNLTMSDSDFLNRAMTESRGSPPTRLEREYFLADKNPKKRENLLDVLLSDPAVAKKVGPEWKKMMLNATATWVFEDVDAGSDWSKLIGELIAVKKTDDQMLEALALAITGRLATDGERKLAGAMVAKQKDKPTAWAEVATALAGTDEAKKHAQKLKGKANVNSIEWYGTNKFEVVPVPVAPKK